MKEIERIQQMQENAHIRRLVVTTEYYHSVNKVAIAMLRDVQELRAKTAKFSSEEFCRRVLIENATRVAYKQYDMLPKKLKEAGMKIVADILRRSTTELADVVGKEMMYWMHKMLRSWGWQDVIHEVEMAEDYRDKYPEEARVRLKNAYANIECALK